MMLRAKISIVISAYNEEGMIEDCLKSVKNLADEIIFVDNTSSDKTVEIAQKYTPKVFKRQNDPVMLNKNKNFGFSKATCDWILSLDADERLTPKLTEEVRKVISGLPAEALEKAGYEIPRKNIIFGKWIQYSIWWPDLNLRLFKKGKGKFPLKHVHEKLEVGGDIGQLQNPMIHLNYQTISQFITKMDRTYTESETENFLKSGKNIFWYDAIRWPTADFVKTFFFQKGYKDGLHGLVLSLLQAFYMLVFFAKVWERKENFADLFSSHPASLGRHPDYSARHSMPSPRHSELDSGSVFLTEVIREFQRSAKDIRYWIYQTLIEENPAKKIYFKIKRRL